jgi:hypothetical protein
MGGQVITRIYGPVGDIIREFLNQTLAENEEACKKKTAPNRPFQGFSISPFCNFGWPEAVGSNNDKGRNGYQMDVNVNYKRYRNGSRINYKATVMIKNQGSSYFHHAILHNFSNDGMYCCSARALQPNSVVTIRFDDQPFEPAPKIYLGEIRRCEKLEDNDHYHLYGLGIKLIGAVVG